MEEYLNKLTDEDHKLFSDALLKIESLISKYLNYKDLEIEFRFGYHSPEAFNSTVPELFFNKIKKNLEASNFKQVSKITQDAFSSGIRKSTTKVGLKNRSTYIKKEKLAILDFSLNGPFDIRVSISREIKMASKDFNDKAVSYQRLKNRTSFLYKSWSFDLTELEFEENSIKQKVFEVELEVDLSKDDDVLYLIHSSLLKVRDLSLFCENESQDLQFILLNEKIFKP